MKTKGLIFLIIGTAVLIATAYTFIMRTKRKGGVTRFLKNQRVDYDSLLVAHESQHYIAIESENNKFHLVKYSNKKRAYQIKTFENHALNHVDFYLDGICVKRIDNMHYQDPEISLKWNDLNLNLVSIRLFIHGIDLPYLLKIDHFAQGNGSSISNNQLIKEITNWVFLFNEIIEKSQQK